jgi:hypothetical protein
MAAVFFKWRRRSSELAARAFYVTQDREKKLENGRILHLKAEITRS